jgi:hypothetical protein
MPVPFRRAGTVRQNYPSKIIGSDLDLGTQGLRFHNSS